MNDDNRAAQHQATTSGFVRRFISALDDELHRVMSLATRDGLEHGDVAVFFEISPNTLLHWRKSVATGKCSLKRYCELVTAYRGDPQVALNRALEEAREAFP